jgi:acyl-CoA reductase-like NAD-dependent aldehyde dehydrogenase
MYVHRSRHDALVDALVAIARSVNVGDGRAPETILGPVSNRPQFKRLQMLLKDALAAGAELRSGGEQPGKRGYFFKPAILTSVADGMRIVDEEQFGPILPIIPYDDLDEAIARANGTPFGLGASVWGEDGERLRHVARELECGTVWINSHAAIGPGDPFCGAKWSGLGVEGGIMGLRSFQQLRVIHEP